MAYQRSGVYGPRRTSDSTPREITAKFASKCSCGKQIKPGDKIMYYPQAHRAECWDCSQETRELLADEENGQAPPW